MTSIVEIRKALSALADRAATANCRFDGTLATLLGCRPEQTPIHENCCSEGELDLLHFFVGQLESLTIDLERKISWFEEAIHGAVPSTVAEPEPMDALRGVGDSGVSVIAKPVMKRARR